MRKLVLLLATERVDSKPGQLGVPPQEAVVVALGSLSHEQDVGRGRRRVPRGRLLGGDGQTEAGAGAGDEHPDALHGTQ